MSDCDLENPLAVRVCAALELPLRAGVAADTTEQTKLEKVRAEKYLLEKGSSGAICSDDVQAYSIFI